MTRTGLSGYSAAAEITAHETMPAMQNGVLLVAFSFFRP
jgi:hypothetical protein